MANNSTFMLTLKVYHPTRSVDEIWDAIDIPTLKTESVGQPRITRSGVDLGGVYEATNIDFRLSHPSRRMEDLTLEDAIREFLSCFDSQYTAEIFETGGSSGFFVGIFPDENVMVEFSHELMGLLSDAKIRIVYDIYDGVEME